MSSAASCEVSSALTVRVLQRLEAEVLVGASVAGGVAVSAASGGSAAFPIVAVVLPIAAGALLLKYAVNLSTADRLIADDKSAFSAFESVLKKQQKTLKKVEIIACTELVDSLMPRVLGSLDTDFCHDYLLLVVTTSEDSATHTDVFEVHFINDSKVHIHVREGGYQVDADEWYATENVPVQFVATTDEGMEAPSALLLNTLEYGFRFAEEHTYNIQMYNCQSFVKTIVKSLDIGKYQLVVDPSIRMWKSVYDGWLRVTGYYDKEVAEEKAAEMGVEYKETDSETPTSEIYEALRVVTRVKSVVRMPVPGDVKTSD